MRNRLKRRKNVKTTPSKGKDQAQTTGIIVLSESSCTDDETLQESLSTAARKKRKVLCKKGLKIAPIFISAIQHKKSKRSSDGGLDQPAGDTQKSAFIPQNDERSLPTAFHLTLRDGCAASACRGQLPPSALHNCLQEIQTLNPAFSVQTVFSTLQKKASKDGVSTEQSFHPGSIQNYLKEKRKLGNEISAKFLNCLQPADADSCFEEVLWTDKYSPQCSSEVIGNAASVNKLLSWLKKWKLRADRDEREKEERKREENDSWDCGDFQGEAGAENQGEGSLSNTMLITGPSGVGKTASVYACAQELGFKVFEVNSSSQRSGRHVLSQLKEATQSHLVEISGKDPLKPAYFSNYSNNSCTPRSEALPGKMVRSKNVTSSLKKRPARSLSSSGRKVKGNPDTRTLAYYFKMKEKADQFHFDGMSLPVKPDGEELVTTALDGEQAGQQSRRSATSLILFEEVDVIFEDDVGFLAAIKAFMTTTRRPVILTTSDPSFKERFYGSLEEILFKTPSAVNVCSYLQLVCLAEEARLDSDDVRSLFTLVCGDVRRCLLQLQLWVLSNEGSGSQFEEFPKQTHKSKSETDMNELLNMLSESWRRGVPLLYSNLQLLLSLAAQGTWDKKAAPELHCEPRCFNSDPHIQRKNLNVSPKVSGASGKPARSLSRLSRKKFKAVVHDAQSSSSSTNRVQRTLSLNWTPLRAHSSSDTNQKAARVETDCLGALENLFDLMSYLDATLPGAEPPVPGSCTPESFIWTGAALKDGLLDEMTRDDGSSHSDSRQGGLIDIKAAAEGLASRICFQKVSEVRTLTQTYSKELGDKRQAGLMDRMMNVSTTGQRLCFTALPLCAPCVSYRRFKLGRMVLSSEYFSLQGNRRAACVDFLPVLRFICRTRHAQQQKGELVRCVNYLSSLGLSNSTTKLLAEDFTQRKVWKDCESHNFQFHCHF